MTSKLLILVAVAACGGGGGGGDVNGVDGGLDLADAGGEECVLPSTSPSWLLEQQDLDLQRMTGEAATPDGAMLQERSTAANRNATRAFLEDRFVELGYQPLFDDYGSGINIYAELEATQTTDDTIVIGAHFDTVPGSPGANDNATGVALVLAAARYAREVECRSHNLLFVLFDEEEIGLVGSDQFAQLLARPDFGARVVEVHTIDQNGWDDDGDRGFELERPDGNLVNGYFEARSEEGLAMPIHQTSTGFTDHVSFRTHGFSAIGITEEYVNGDTTPHYHLSSDSYETVDRDYLASTTRVFLRMLGNKLRSPAASARGDAPRAGLDERYRTALTTPRQPSMRRPGGCRGRMRVTVR